MTNEQPTEIWQVEANGRLFDTTFAEMTQWIEEGSLLRVDRVRKGNLRWIEAGKVPALLSVFNAKDRGEPVSLPTVSTTVLGPTSLPPTSSVPVNPPIASHVAGAAAACCMHPEMEAAYSCDTCLNLFCGTCPSSYGGSVKICPMCGAICSKLAVEAAEISVRTAYAPAGNAFGFSDLLNALAYPFKFKGSLVMGALMYAFFSIGQTVTGFGGMFMMSGSIACFMMANTLTFGILANTAENFSQGNIGGNFMPAFDDFSIWDDVVQPFFLSIGVYVSSFGPLIAVVLLAVFFLVGSIGSELNAGQSKAADAVSPELPYAAKAARQSEEIKGLLNKKGDAQQERVDALNDGQASIDEKVERMAPRETDDEEFERLNSMIQQQRKAQLESVVGKAPETRDGESRAFLSQLVGYGSLFLLVAGLCLLWGLFYFPAACAVAGYTQSFAATLNPTVGLDTVRRLGIDYLKILLMTLAIFAMSIIITGVIGAMLSAFDMPGVGNIPAKALSSVIGFYFSVVFSCIIGFALYKGADRLNLAR